MISLKALFARIFFENTFVTFFTATPSPVAVLLAALDRRRRRSSCQDHSDTRSGCKGDEQQGTHSPDDTISSLAKLLVDDVTLVDDKVLVEDLEDLPTGHSPFHVEVMRCPYEVVPKVEINVRLFFLVRSCGRAFSSVMRYLVPRNKSIMAGHLFGYQAPDDVTDERERERDRERGHTINDKDQQRREEIKRRGERVKGEGRIPSRNLVRLRYQLV